MTWERYAEKHFAVFKADQVGDYYLFCKLSLKIFFPKLKKVENNTQPFVDSLITNMKMGNLSFECTVSQFHMICILTMEAIIKSTVKRNTVIALKKQAITNCPDNNSKAEEMKKVELRLECNGYPQQIIRNC